MPGAAPEDCGTVYAGPRLAAFDRQHRALRPQIRRESPAAQSCEIPAAEVAVAHNKPAPDEHIRPGQPTTAKSQEQAISSYRNLTSSQLMIR
jgi:hypothetical protein